MTDQLTIAAYRTHASGRIQITLSQTDEQGRGWGRRLAGPKHYNSGTTELVSAVLDADDARELRRMLDAAFPIDAVAHAPASTDSTTTATTARTALLAELLAGEDPTAEEYPDAVARLEGLVDAAITEGIRNATAIKES